MLPSASARLPSRTPSPSRTSSSSISLYLPLLGSTDRKNDVKYSSSYKSTRGQRFFSLCLVTVGLVFTLHRYTELPSSTTAWLPTLPFGDSALGDDRRGVDPLASAIGISRLEEMCAKRECSFLLPFHIGEQETKAQQHLHQLGLLARALDRTLVLPRVKSSRFGACLLHPFDRYYEQDALERLGVETVLMDDWEAWAGRPSADGQVVSFGGVKSERSEGVVRTVMGQVEREKVERMLECVDEGKVRLNGSRIDFGVATKPSTLAEHRAQVAHLVVDTLQQVASSTPLLVDYDLRYPFLSPSSFDLTPAVKPFAFFPLQAHYLALADALTHRLGPYVAIHWRMETLDPSSLHACANALLEHLLRLKQTNAELRSVYLATDYPVDGLLQRDGKVGRLAHSGTFTKSLTEEHERVMRGFVEDFGTSAERLGLRLTSFAREVEELRKGRPRRLHFGHGHSTPVLGLDHGSLDNLLADSSTSSLVDSLVAQRADIFLAGLPSFRGQESKACGKYSSFTSRIEQARKEVLGIERTVRYFERVLEAGGE